MQHQHLSHWISLHRNLNMHKNVWFHISFLSTTANKEHKYKIIKTSGLMKYSRSNALTSFWEGMLLTQESRQRFQVKGNAEDWYTEITRILVLSQVSVTTSLVKFSREPWHFLNEESWKKYHFLMKLNETKRAVIQIPWTERPVEHFQMLCSQSDGITTQQQMTQQLLLCSLCDFFYSYCCAYVQLFFMHTQNHTKNIRSCLAATLSYL